MKKTAILGILAILALTASAQASLIDGTSGVLYHLDAAQGVTVGGTYGGVIAWADQSGNGYNFAGTGGGLSLVSSVAGLNNLPAIHSAEVGELQNDSLKLSTSTTVKTVMIVNLGAAQARDYVGIWGGNTDNSIRRDTKGNTIWRTGGGGDFPTSMYISGAATNVQAAGTAGILEAFNSSGMTFTKTSIDCVYYDRRWLGDIAEIAVYNRVLNTAERIITENYFGSKFNIAVANDKYAGDASGYDFNVVGIGYEDASNKLTASPVAGKSDGLILAENTALATAGQYLLAGDKNLANSLVQTDLPTGISDRWARDWYLDKTGSLDAQLTFDFSDGGLTYDSGNTYDLLYRANETDPFSKLNLTGTAGGDQVTFAVGDGTLADGYYTIGVVPEPGALALLALGGIGMLIRRRRRA